MLSMVHSNAAETAYHPNDKGSFMYHHTVKPTQRNPGAFQNALSAYHEPPAAGRLSDREYTERSARYAHSLDRIDMRAPRHERNGTSGDYAMGVFGSMMASRGAFRALPATIGAAAGVIQMMKEREKSSSYNKIDYTKSSKFRFIRWYRRRHTGFATKAKSGINFLTVKYKKGGKPYYMTTRSVPATNKHGFKLKHGHSEQRYKRLKSSFEAKHKLDDSHIEWAATEREPCGHGPGLANCRHTLSGIGIPHNKIHYAFDYVDGEDMRSKPDQALSGLHDLASTHRGRHNDMMEEKVAQLGKYHDSDDESENDDDVLDEYEHHYGENEAEKRKKKSGGLAGAFRDGWDK